jgi:hypothetical protein
MTMSECHFDSKLAKPLDDPRSPLLSTFAQHLQAGFDQIEACHMQREQVNLPLFVIRTQLDTGNDSDSERFAGCQREWNTCRRIVISQSDRAQSCLVSGSDYFIRRKRSVGRRRMTVKIDEARSRGGVADLSHRA